MLLPVSFNRRRYNISKPYAPGASFVHRKGSDYENELTRAYAAMTGQAYSFGGWFFVENEEAEGMVSASYTNLIFSIYETAGWVDPVMTAYFNSGNLNIFSNSSTGAFSATLSTDIEPDPYGGQWVFFWVAIDTAQSPAASAWCYDEKTRTLYDSDDFAIVQPTGVNSLLTSAGTFSTGDNSIPGALRPPSLSYGMQFIDGHKVNPITSGIIVPHPIANNVYVPGNYAGLKGEESADLFVLPERSTAAAIISNDFGSWAEDDATDVNVDNVSRHTPAKRFPRFEILYCNTADYELTHHHHPIYTGTNSNIWDRTAMTDLPVDGNDPDGWYFEFDYKSESDATDGPMVGFCPDQLRYSHYANDGFFRMDGDKSQARSSASYGSTVSVGTRVCCALKAGAIWFGTVSGGTITWENSATTAEIIAGTTTNAAYTNLTDSELYVTIIQDTATTAQETRFYFDKADWQGFVPGLKEICNLNLYPDVSESVLDPDDHFYQITGSGSTIEATIASAVAGWTNFFYILKKLDDGTSGSNDEWFVRFSHDSGNEYFVDNSLMTPQGYQSRHTLSASNQFRAWVFRCDTNGVGKCGSIAAGGGSTNITHNHGTTDCIVIRADRSTGEIHFSHPFTDINFSMEFGMEAAVSAANVINSITTTTANIDRDGSTPVDWVVIANGDIHKIQELDEACGFIGSHEARPKFIMTKRWSASGQWHLYDTASMWRESSDPDLFYQVGLGGIQPDVNGGADVYDNKHGTKIEYAGGFTADALVWLIPESREQRTF